MNAYFNPLVKDGNLVISRMGYVNSAAISLYPILKNMGFNIEELKKKNYL